MKAAAVNLSALNIAIATHSRSSYLRWLLSHHALRCCSWARLGLGWIQRRITPYLPNRPLSRTWFLKLVRKMANFSRTLKGSLQLRNEPVILRRLRLIITRERSDRILKGAKKSQRHCSFGAKNKEYNQTIESALQYRVLHRSTPLQSTVTHMFCDYAESYPYSYFNLFNKMINSASRPGRLAFALA
jgi:hypothetical protein